MDATLWKGSDGTAYTAAEVYTRGNMKPSTKKLVIRHMATPEQAIAATLGRGTCRNSAPTYLDFLCSECGFVHYHSDENDSGDGNEWRFCPNCGRKVVSE